MMVQPTGIELLPNEIIITLLSSLSTRTLLPLTSVSHRFHDLILRILHHRLIHTASLKDYRLILECFHSSTKLSTPYIFCDYLGTDGLSDDVEGEGYLYKDVEKTGRLGKLPGLYSHFRPVRPNEERKIRRPHPAGDVPGHPNTSTWFPGLSNGPSEEQEPEYVCQNINLEPQELFSQICTITDLLKVGPRRGLFLGCVNIGEGVIQVWRDWLAERAAALTANWKTKSPSEASKKAEKEDYGKRMLWADSGSNVGLRLRVVERADVPALLLVRRDENAPVSYTLQYEELVIRTTRLLLKVEQSLDLEVNHSSKAIVIGDCGYDQAASSFNLYGN